MTKEKLDLLRDRVLKSRKKKEAEEDEKYCDGVLDMYSEVLKTVN